MEETGKEQPWWKRHHRIGIVLVVAIVAGVATYVGCPDEPREPAEVRPGMTVPELMEVRGLSEADVRAALTTYHPSGEQDEFLMFASGGQAGNLIVIGVPSMRILRYVGVFTPEPWQGYGYDDDTAAMLADSQRFGQEITWGDMHHPALSQTEGDYDGEFLFANDKANPRVAVIDLSDLVTKQIVGTELIQSEHGSTFVTPNTEYVIQSSQYPAPLGGEFAPIEEYDESYRGAVIFWSFDREAGRIDEDASFAIELPPYMQDLVGAGVLESDGWAFINSFNTERAYGGIQEGNPPMESGSAEFDTDFLHLVDWRSAEQVVANGDTTTISGLPVISLDTAVEEGLLYFVPASKSPHGVDITPDGADIVVSGKLDTHASVFSFSQMMDLIEREQFDGTDDYGVPILPMEESLRGQAEIGLGPLHTQFDGQGYAYTSVYIESVIAKWSLDSLEVVDKIPVHYNVGHLAIPGGDTVNPRGRFLVSMNKWALDRFSPTGPLFPQTFQLIDIAGEEMELLYDMPLPLGEPHYAQMIEADLLDMDTIYPIGYNPIRGEIDEDAVQPGEERIERRGDEVHVYMTAIRSHFNPDIVRLREGDTVHLNLTSVEQAEDAIHGFTIGGHDIHVSLEPGKHVNLTFEADKPGVWPMYCTEFCSALHLEMAGYFLVEPREDQ